MILPSSLSFSIFVLFSVTALEYYMLCQRKHTEFLEGKARFFWEKHGILKKKVADDAETPTTVGF
jgi:hypothetical protein